MKDLIEQLEMNDLVVQLVRFYQESYLRLLKQQTFYFNRRYMRGITLPKKDKYTINIFVLDANEFKHYRINHSKLFIKKYNH